MLDCNEVEKEWLVTLATINPSEVDYEDFVPCARRLARQLKEQEGVEIIVALTHMRVPNDELLAHEASSDGSFQRPLLLA